MPTSQQPRTLCPDLLDGTYDCVDRIVLRAYFRFIQEPGGFRLWWRRWQSSEEQLDDAHLMRVAGHFARRLKAWAKAAGVPVIFSGAGHRKELISAALMPADPDFTGLFLVVVGRAPASVWHVEHTADGRIRRIQRKRPWVNHYAFHIRDREWGHLVIRFCPHPPFNALVILNGHEWVAAEAVRRGIAFCKEDNCFTELSNAAGLGQIAETLSSESSVGRLLQVCERWIYSAVLCFAVDIADQERTDFQYSYSIYQAEYSRNLLFRHGAEMDQLFQRLIDRVRGRLQLKTVCTLFGRRQRPRRRKGALHEPTVEVVLERPEYDLIIIRVHFDRLTLKIYTKGERVLRIEAMAHNARDLRCGTSLERYGLMMAALRQMVKRFIEVLDCIDAAFIEPGMLDTLPQPSQVGRARVGGVDLNRARMRAVVESVLALGPMPRGFSASDVAERVRANLSDEKYTTSRAAYDLRKLRGKGLVSKLPRSRRYSACPQALRALGALVVLRDQVIRPLLAGALRMELTTRPRHLAPIDKRYRALRRGMNELLCEVGIAA
jgi:DNA-binding transcriptional ArsR family regulator